MVPQHNFLLLANTVELSLLKLKLVFVPLYLFLVVKVKVSLILLKLKLLLESEELSMIVGELIVFDMLIDGAVVDGIDIFSVGSVSSW